MVYHQKDTTKIDYHRFLAIDPLWFDDDGVIHVETTRDTDEPAPLSGSHPRAQAASRASNETPAR